MYGRVQILHRPWPAALLRAAQGVPEGGGRPVKNGIFCPACGELVELKAKPGTEQLWARCKDCNLDMQLLKIGVEVGHHFMLNITQPRGEQPWLPVKSDLNSYRCLNC